LGAGYEKGLFKVSSDLKVDVAEKRLTFNVRLYPYDADMEQEATPYFVIKRELGAGEQRSA
jgi:hypothetical protein